MTRYQAFLYAVQFIMASLCAWSCFCRLVRTNAETVREIRWTNSSRWRARGCG